MKKITLPLIILFTAVLFLPSKVYSQTRQECEKNRDRASYNCLLKFGECYSPCVAETKENTSCRDSCKQSQDTCDEESDSQYKICLGTLPETQENTALEKAEQVEVQANPDCHEVFTKESNTCLKESNECINSCVDKGTAAMSLTVDGGKVMKECTRSVCDPASKACDDQATANFRACQDAKSTAKESVKEEAPPLEKPLDVPVFVGEWFSRFSQAIDGLIALPGAFADVVYEDKFHLAGDLPKLSEMSLEDFYQGNWYPNDDTPDRSPSITVKDEQKAWDFGLLDTPLTEKVSIVVLQGEAQLKGPDSPQFIPIAPKGGDTVQVSYFDSTVKATSDGVQLRYSWSADSGAVINVSKWSEIKFREPMKVSGSTSHNVKLEQGEIEVRVRNTNPSENQFGVDAGWLGVTASRTHFWVSQSKDKKMAVIGVLEGEVEVKTRNGRTIKVAPDGDKPGVVVVSQKLSVVKLATTGLVVGGVIGGIIWLIKRRSSQKTKKR